MNDNNNDINDNIKEGSKIKENIVIEITEEKINYYKRKKEAEDNKKANKLCIISVLLNFVPFFLFSIFEFDGFYKLFGYNESKIGNVYVLIMKLISLCPLISFSLMVYVREKYPKNTFGRILMILYIIVIILIIVFTILFMITCVESLKYLKSCPG